MIAAIAPLFKQEKSCWDWAACAQMVAASGAISPPMNPLPTQVDIVRSQLGSLANVPQNDQEILSLYRTGKVGGVPIRCVLIQGPLEQFELDQTLQDGGPVEIGLQFSGGCGHVSLVVGTEDVNGRCLYIVHDPALGRGRFTYDGLRSAYGKGHWFLTFAAFERL